MASPADNGRSRWGSFLATVIFLGIMVAFYLWPNPA